MSSFSEPLVSNAAFDALLDRVRDACGLSFPKDRRPDMEAAIRRAMEGTGATDLGEYVAGILSGARTMSDLIDAVTVRETYFFREPAQFAFLREVVLPEIVARRPEGEIVCWSAGCASGEEAYSLAILLEEMGLSRRVRIVGTDIAEAALTAARAAVYRPWSLRGDEAHRARRHLVEKDDEWSLSEAIRQRVTFEQLNLIEDAAPLAPLGLARCDLVLCRNTLIYFKGRALTAAVKNLYESLRPGGWLIAASSDPPLATYEPFVCTATPRGLFYRKRLADGSIDVSRETGAAARAAPRVSTPSLGLSSRPRPLPGAYIRTVRKTPLPPAGRRSVTMSSALPRAASRVAAPGVRPPAVVAEPALSSDDVERLVALGEVDEAERLVTARMKREPLDPAHPYLLSVLFVQARREADAIKALRRAIYLDGQFVTAHLALGMALARSSDVVGARRAFKTVERLCKGLPAGRTVPFSGGHTAATISAIARQQDEALDRRGTVR